MKANVRLAIAAAAVMVLGSAVDRELRAQALAPAPAGPQASDRAKVLEALARGDSAGAEKIVTELQAQLQAGPTVPGIAPAAASWQTFFEELKDCGFYPQETRLECVIEIKQPGGYGGRLDAPGPITGTMEHVYFCVDWYAGAYTQLESVGQGSVAMYDGPAPVKYAVYRDFNVFSGTRTRTKPVAAVAGNVVTATTAPAVPVFTVKAILSWAFAPTGCNYVPVWGNILNFRIRMDPIR